MDLFDIIPEKFFSILSSKNKRLYVSCLVETFKIYELGSILGIDKKTVADELERFLDSKKLKYDTSEEETFDGEILDEDAKEANDNNRSLAYFVLKKFEECGWIYIDVDMDYQEILNFTDAGITFTESIMHINPLYNYNGSYDDDFDEVAYIQAYNNNEYTGYIYTIYSLLNNPLNTDYPTIIFEVFRNTKLLIRALRKLDSRLKDYITSVVETSEINDLIIKLMDYKSELLDQGYSKLKTGDNINKYRLPIVTRLEKFEHDDNIMYQITNDYRNRFSSYDEALKRAYRDIDEMIDVFNSLDNYISEIDFKNKKYIDSTIGKIKFLLSEDDNITGKLNTILRYIKVQNKAGKVDSAINKVNELFTLRESKLYNNESSIYTPRGKYSRVQNQMLALDDFDFGEDAKSFISHYALPYNDESIKDFIAHQQFEGEIRASQIIQYNTDIDVFMMLIYTLIYACEHSWDIEKIDEDVLHYKFKFKDFIIKVGE